MRAGAPHGLRDMGWEEVGRAEATWSPKGGSGQLRPEPGPRCGRLCPLPVGGAGWTLGGEVDSARSLGGLGAAGEARGPQGNDTLPSGPARAPGGGHAITRSLGLLSYKMDMTGPTLDNEPKRVPYTNSCKTPPRPQRPALPIGANKRLRAKRPEHDRSCVHTLRPQRTGFSVRRFRAIAPSSPWPRSTDVLNSHFTAEDAEARGEGGLCPRSPGCRRQSGGAV